MNVFLISAEELGITELIPAYLDPNLKLVDLKKGVSFASGGSGYVPETAKLAVHRLNATLILFYLDITLTIFFVHGLDIRLVHRTEHSIIKFFSSVLKLFPFILC